MKNFKALALLFVKLSSVALVTLICTALVSSFLNGNEEGLTTTWRWSMLMVGAAVGYRVFKNGETKEE